MNTLKTIEGTKDYFELDADRFAKIIQTAERIFSLHTYRPIHTPVFEATELFARSIGAATDIVEKEMYTFTPGSDTITLRPEGTAGVIRAYIQHHFQQQSSLTKLWYYGAMFRRERPQKGRQRQFHQVGVEAIGSSSPLLDAEVIAMALMLYHELGITGVQTKVHSIGCQLCRPAYREILRSKVSENLADYCKTCQGRYEKNLLRIFDCKNPTCKILTEPLPKAYQSLCETCSRHFAQLQEALDAKNVSYIVDGALVRGLDYYTKTVFEFTHNALGSQDAIGGGGRYDGLVKELGGNDTPAVGFALGIERMLIAMEALKCCSCHIPLMVFGISIGELAQKAMSGILMRLRALGISCDMDFEGKSLKSQMRTANSRNALYTIILGDDELSRGEVVLKNMKEGGEQTAVSLPDLFDAAMKLFSIKNTSV